MSEDKNKNQNPNKGNDNSKIPTKINGWIGESKSQQDILRKGAEIPPRPIPTPTPSPEKKD